MPFAHVALPLPVRQTFLYRIPEALVPRAVPGAQVAVPFRGRANRGLSSLFIGSRIHRASSRSCAICGA